MQGYGNSFFVENIHRSLHFLYHWYPIPVNVEDNDNNHDNTYENGIPVLVSLHIEHLSLLFLITLIPMPLHEVVVAQPDDIIIIVIMVMIMIMVMIPSNQHDEQV